MDYEEKQFNGEYMQAVVGRHYEDGVAFTDEELRDMSTYFDIFKCSTEVFETLNRPVDEKTLVEDLTRMINEDIYIFATSDCIYWAMKIYYNKNAYADFAKAIIHMLTGIYADRCLTVEG